MKKLILLGLLAACGSTGGTGSRYVAVTHNVGGTAEAHMTRTSSSPSAGTTMEAEYHIQDGTLLIRFGDSGVQLDMSDFPGDTITRYFDELEVPMEFKLPDGTSFIYRGDSIEVGGESYDLPMGVGVVRYVHPGEFITD